MHITGEKCSLKQLDNVILIAIIGLLYFISKQNYILFHTIVELGTVLISLSVSMIAIGTEKISENKYFTFLGISYGFVGILDLLHSLTYKGVGIFTNSDNISIQFRLSARIMEVCLLMISLKFINKRADYKRMTIINFTIIAIIIFCILMGYAPILYVSNTGLTFLKKVIEYVLCVIFLAFISIYKNSRDNIIKDNKSLLIFSMSFKAMSELLFAVYTNDYGIVNFLGHICKLISFYFFFRILFKNIVIDPYSTLFQKLNRKAIELEQTNNELEEARQRFMNSSKRYENLISFLPDGIMLVKNSIIVYGNSRTFNILGYNDGSRVLNSSIYSIVDGAYHEKLTKRLTVEDKDQLLSPEEYELIGAEKSVHVEISSLFISDEDGQYLLSVVRDITDKKAAENAYSMLIEKQKEDEIKNEFFTNITHELKTPINVIYSAVQLQLDCFESLRDEEHLKYNKIIKQNCFRLIRLVNNLIDITRIESGFLKPIMEVENIVSVVEDITLSIANLVRAKGMNLIFDTEIEELSVSCDSNLIERIMLNLLSNAIKYGKEGGNISVCISLKNTDFVVISVKDDGIGIPDDMKEKVFQRFQKVDKSLSRNSEGSGIGLSLVKGLVEIQKGTIEFASKFNEGTEFYITFPISKQQEDSNMANLRAINYEKNNIETVEIEFSDIYYK